MFFTERLMLRGPDMAADLPVLLQWHNSAEHLHGITSDAPYPRSREWVRKLIAEQTDPATNKAPFFMICERPAHALGQSAREIELALEPGDDYFLLDPGPSGPTSTSTTTTTGAGAPRAPSPRYPAIGFLRTQLVAHHLGGMSGMATVGISFAEQHTGRGYGTEVLRWLCEYMFRTVGLHRLELRLDATNARALRCYEKVGFVKEGVRRKRSWRDGEWRDQIEMGILEQDWFSLARDRPKGDGQPEPRFWT